MNILQFLFRRTTKNNIKMTRKAQIILLKLFLFVFLASAKKIFKSRAERNTFVPISDAQKESIVENVCTVDLVFYFEDSEEDIQRCKEHFRWHMDRDRSGLQLRCRSEATVTLQVPVSNLYQIVLLVPHPNDEHSLEYSIVSPNSKYAVLDASPNTNYSIYSSVLVGRGTPLVWHREGLLHHWRAPTKRAYDIRVNLLRNDDLLRGIVSWNRTGDLDTCFEVFSKCQRRFWLFSKKIWPDSPPEIDIGKLPPNDTCFVTVRGMHGSTKHPFDTYPTLTYNNTEEPAPENIELSPRNIVVIRHDIEIPQENAKSFQDKKVKQDLQPVENIHLHSEEDGDKWTVHVWWPEPAVLPDRYNITLRASDFTTLVLPGNTTTAEFRGVLSTKNHLYNVSVYSFLGDEMAHNSRSAIFTSGARGGGRAAWAGAGAACWLAAALAGLFCRLRRRARSPVPHTKLKMSGESKVSECTTETCSVDSQPAADAWEIDIDQLLLHEVIGEGAFGVVRRGTLAPLGKEVAVKMLKDFPSTEEMRAFRVEMEVMKSVGGHAHVVSLLGCSTARHPHAVVAEYCARGDLLNFLRCSWDVMVSKRNANYYNNNNINTAEYRNDLFKCKTEHSRLVVNKMYELQGVCDTELTPQDLLSFCRQIAMGMEFLALNKVVHRDLAARNILVTSDRTLKIADFGLSRDVYEENQYKQKGNCKMPVKWMALESLTRRIYTTQSDVWSFGIVMWEVVTVGGAPYAGVAAARLPRLLRAGYRMPRPNNCTQPLYELMRACWAERPRDRPTFAELHERLDDLLKNAAADEYLSLEIDDEPPPTPKAHRYFKMIMRAKKSWSRNENYERPLKAPRNHYSSPPVSKHGVCGVV